MSDTTPTLPPEEMPEEPEQWGEMRVVQALTAFVVYSGKLRSFALAERERRVKAEAQLIDLLDGAQAVALTDATHRAETAERQLAAARAEVANDAENWGNALNAASWEFVETYQKQFGEPVSAKLFNYGKGMIRSAILKYIRSLGDKQ